ncbi:GNAT family N-acetyltransferase [bacterium]|nr:GNAT family N-acetyltransferase [bacterium]
MQPLNPSQYHTVAPLFQQQAHHTVLHTILSGQTPGHVYVDDLTSPTLGLAQFRHRVFPSGEPDRDAATKLAALLMDAVAENCRAAGVPLWRLAVSDPAWLPLLKKALARHQPIQENYQVFRYQITTPITPPTEPSSFTLKPVDAALLDQTFEGKTDLIEEMCSERESVEAFLDQSFGLSAFKDDALAGWCLSEYNFENRCEIGIATLPPHQRQGLARRMTLTFLEQARQKNFNTILWHCEKTNIASAKTARSAGFDLVEDQPVLIQYIDPAIHLGVLGNIQFHDEHYQEAIPYYQSALAEASPPDWVAWNGALAAAQTGDPDLAFDLLAQACASGFATRDRLEKTQHLAPLREDSRWQRLIDQLPAA